MVDSVLVEEMLHMALAANLLNARGRAIGQFYDAIRQGLHNLCDHFGEATVFCGDPAR